MMNQGCVFALTGKASDAVHKITSGITAVRSTGATLWMPLYLSYLARAYAELGQFDDAWRCIGEAMTAMETTKETWFEAEVTSHRRRNRAEVAGAGCGESRSVFRPRPRGRAPTTSKILGTPRRNEPRAPLARPGQGAASARTAGSGLRVVHGGVRHARSEGGEGVAGGVGGVVVCYVWRCLSPM